MQKAGVAALLAGMLSACTDSGTGLAPSQSALEKADVEDAAEVALTDDEDGDDISALPDDQAESLTALQEDIAAASRVQCPGIRRADQCRKDARCRWAIGFVRRPGPIVGVPVVRGRPIRPLRARRAIAFGRCVGFVQPRRRVRPGRPGPVPRR
jgi:hypothetical protein